MLDENGENLKKLTQFDLEQPTRILAVSLVSRLQILFRSRVGHGYSIHATLSWRP